MENRHLASEEIGNGTQTGYIRVERTSDANCFRINRGKLKQYFSDGTSTKSGMREIGPGVREFGIFYRKNFCNTAYDVDCVDCNGEVLRKYSF